MTAYNTETLSLGGGIVEVGSIDMGFCPSFNLLVEVEKIVKYKYYEKGPGSVLKLPVKDGSKLTSLNVTGQFICESIMYDTIQKLGFFSSPGSGNILSLLTSDLPLNCFSIVFTSSPRVGKQIVVEIADAFIEPTDAFELLNATSWKNISFNFTGLLDDFDANPPNLQLNTL